MTWRWPWVSRALYDVVLFQRDTSRTDEKMRESIALQRQMEWTDALHHERERYAKAEATIQHLRTMMDVQHQSGGDNLLRAKGAEIRAERAEQLYDDLLARYHALKLQGATTPEPERTIPAKPIDPVLSAINDASAGKDAKVRVGMIRQAAVDKEAGLKPEDIILRIQRGNRPAEEVG